MMVPGGSLCAALAAAALVAMPASVSPAPGPTTQVTSVALDLTALDEATYKKVGALALEKQAVLRLVQESFAVVAPTATPDVRLSIVVLPRPDGATEANETILKLTGTSSAGTEYREVAIGSEAQQELHLEVSQKLVELARALTPPPKVPDPVPVPPPPPEPRWWSVDVTLGGGAVIRGGGNDPEARLTLRWGGRLGVVLTGSWSPTLSSDLRVLEWTILAGPSWRQPIDEQLEVEVGLLGGVLLHHYTVWNEYAADESGDRQDWALSLPVMLTWRPNSVLSVSLRVAGRVVGNSREHLLNDRRLWRREAWALEAGGMVGARF
ncbi:MAG: hypothetical protein QM765_04210 [Myxococcales bacterium]